MALTTGRLRGAMGTVRGQGAYREAYLWDFVVQSGNNGPAYEDA